MRKLLFLYTVMSLGLISGTAHAAPPEVKAHFTETAPYSTASFRMLMFKVYDIELYTDAEQWSYDAPFALRLIYDTSIEGEDIAERSVDEIEKYHTLTPEEQKEYLATFTRLFPNVKTGDSLTAVYAPGKDMQLYFNGALRGTVTDLTLARRFLDIWLTPKSEYPDIRNTLVKNSRA